MASSSYIESENYSQSQDNLSDIELNNQDSSIAPEDSISSSTIFNYIENRPSFQLDPPSKSKIYIFANKLFTQSLLPIDLTKKRQMLVSCTR